MAFQCTVVTPEEQVLDQSVTQAILPAHDGELGILTGRAPILVKLGIGVLRLDLPGGPAKSFLLEGGVAQMKDNKLTILTGNAIPPEKIDVEAARAELAEATARVASKPADIEERDNSLARARAKIALAGK